MRVVMCCVAAMAAGTAHAGLLVNSGFDPDQPVASNNILPGGSTAIPGWTTILSGAEWFDTTSSGASSNGGYAVDLANFTFTGGGVQQTFATEVGQAYTIGFEIGTSTFAGRSGTGEIFVEAAGDSELFIAENASTVTLWREVTFTFTALDSETTLTFSNTQNANLHFAFIDGVRIVPAPGAAASLLVAPALLRRRR
jgi:hypothetical protein